MISSRRSFLTGLTATLITAPAIVRAGSLMPVKQMIEPDWVSGWHPVGPIHRIIYFQNRYVWVSGKDSIIHFSKLCEEGSWTPMTS